MTAMQQYVMESHWPAVSKSEFWTVPVSHNRFVYIMTPPRRMTRDEWDLMMQWLKVSEQALAERVDNDTDYWLAEWNK